MTASSRPVPSSALSRSHGWRPSLGGVARGLGRVLLGVAIALAIVVGVAAFTSGQQVTLPAVTGSSAVGRVELTLTDPTRTDPFLNDGRDRELAIWVWYPATGTGGAGAADYFPTGWAALPPALPFTQDVTRVTTNAHENAALDGSPPVVILQPGLGLPVGSYTALAEDLASHGYAVVGINETGSAGAVFPDGHVVPATAAGGVMGAGIDAWYADADRVTSTWAADALFVARSLAAAPPAIGTLDFSRVAYVGHSVGGASAFEACRQDDRCAAAVNLDGTLWTEVRESGLRAPHLLVQKDRSDACDEFCRRAEADFDAVMAENGRHISIAGSTHSDFQDDALLPALVHQVGLGSIDGVRMNQIVRDTVRSFLDVHVLGSPPADFTEAVKRYSEISVIR